MSKMSVFEKIQRHLRAFRLAREGNVATVFALASLPVIGMVGAAVDYSHVNSARTAMQQALDATALMLSKEATNLTTEQMNTKATDYFRALYTRPEVTDIKVTPTYTTTDGSQVVLNGSGVVKSSIMNILGITNVKITGSSTVAWGQVRLRVALALDVTGSMDSDGKMDAMKKAAKSLLDQMKAAASKNGDVYVSIIPFAKVVNVGKSNYNQTWVDFADHGSWDGWDSENGDGVTTCTGKKKSKKCTTNWVPDNHNTWNGCVTDRDQDYDIGNAAPDANIQATRFPAEPDKDVDCPAPLMALSYDWTALKTKIDGLAPAGNTNQVIGLAWAFQSLTASPFTIPAKEKNYNYSDIIILMTDGLNTETRYSKTRADIDTREKALCENVKKAKITIYTIQVNTGGDPTQQVLKDCATDSSKFFEIKQSNQLVSVFSQIGTALSQLRVAK